MYEYYRAPQAYNKQILHFIDWDHAKIARKMLQNYKIENIKNKTKFLQQNLNDNDDPYLTCLLTVLESNNSLSPLERIQKLSFICSKQTFLFGKKILKKKKLLLVQSVIQNTKHIAIHFTNPSTSIVICCFIISSLLTPSAN